MFKLKHFFLTYFVNKNDPFRCFLREFEDIIKLLNEGKVSHSCLFMVTICVLQFFRCNLIGIALTLENQFYFELDRTPLEFNVQPNDAPLAHTTSPVFLVAIYLYYCLRIRPSSIVWPFIYQLVINNKRSVNDIDSSFKIGKLCMLNIALEIKLSRL